MFEHEITDWSNKRRFNWPAVALAVIISLFFTISPASIRASPAAGPLSCVVTDTITSSVTYHATNATISWTVQVKSTIYLYWGNTTNYGYTAVNGTVYGAGTNTTFLDFLEPGTNYYYYVEAMFDPPHPYYCPGTYSGGWTTPADHMTSISGTVFNSQGAPASGLEIEIAVRCATTNPPWIDYPGTSANGYYSDNLAIGNKVVCTPPPYGGYAITAFASAPSGSPYQPWLGHWNETIVTWAPQVVNFYLSIDQPSSSTEPFVDEMEFTHSPNALLDECSSSSSSWEYQSTSAWSGSLFGLSFSTQSTSAVGSASGSYGCILNQGEPGSETWGEEMTSGMIVFNAVTGRVGHVAWEQTYGGLVNGGNAGSGNATGAPIQDWISEPTSSSGACTIGGITWFQWPVNAHSGTETYGMTVSGSVSGVSGQTWGGSIPLVLDGVTFGSFGLSYGYTLGTSESNEFQADMVFPPASVTQYFTVVCTGGSQGSGTGIVLHVWQDSS